MRTKLLLSVLLMWTASTARSQDTINKNPFPHVETRFIASPPGNDASRDTLDLRQVSFPFWMVKQLALDLEEKQRLEQMARLDSAEISGYKDLVSSLEKQGQHRQLQVELLRKQSGMLQLQLKAVNQRAPPTNTLTWTLRLLAALGTGYILGSLGN